jgi:hypothetical protein
VWVETRERTGGPARAPVVTGPWGALALDPWTLKIGGDDLDRRWHLDPFRFFAEAFGTHRLPAPHPSVLNGRRMWFCQIDGDGFESLSTVQPDEYSAKVMRDDVLAHYALPFTVSIIVAGLTTDYAVEKPTRAMVLAREILNQPNVEPASHGVLHTLEWRRTLAESTEERRVMWYPSLRNYEYGTVAEVSDSIRFIDERLLDEGRRCRVMLWTGEANPFEDAVQAAVARDCWNLNGGLCSPDNLVELVEAIRAACRHPLFGQGKVEPKSLEQTRAYLSPELMAKKFWALYQQTLPRSGLPG